MKIGGLLQWLLIYCPIYWLILWFVPGSSIGVNLLLHVPTFFAAIYVDHRVSKWRQARYDALQAQKDVENQ